MEEAVSKVESAEEITGDDENQGADEKVDDDKEQEVDEEIAEAVQVVLEVIIGGDSKEESLYDEFSRIVPSPPEPPEFVLPIPDPVENQILIKPNERKPRRKITSFKIVTIGKPHPIGGTDNFKMLSEEDIANLDEEAKANYEADVQEKQALKNSSRWILPAKSQISLAIEFASKQTGKSDSILEFEIVGNSRTFAVSAHGVVLFLPSINNPWLCLHAVQEEDHRLKKFISAMLMDALRMNSVHC